MTITIHDEILFVKYITACVRTSVTQLGDKAVKKENDIIQSDPQRFICQIDGIDAFLVESVEASTTKMDLVMWDCEIPSTINQLQQWRKDKNPRKAELKFLNEDGSTKVKFDYINCKIADFRVKGSYNNQKTSLNSDFSTIRVWVDCEMI